MVYDKELAWNYYPLNYRQRRFIEAREENLILNLTLPKRGETFLEIGCAGGDHLQLFYNKGCSVTGVDPSLPLLEAARQKLHDKAELHLGKAEDLPFSDNEFDIVSLILSERLMTDPEKAISEAVRVCRGRVFIGVMNKFSLAVAHLRLQQLLKNDLLYSEGRSFYIMEVLGIIRRILPGVQVRWGSVIFLPTEWSGLAHRFEKVIPAMKNPFGAFLGLCFPVVFNLRTIQDIIQEPFKLKTNGRQPAQGIIRGKGA